MIPRLIQKILSSGTCCYVVLLDKNDMVDIIHLEESRFFHMSQSPLHLKDLSHIEEFRADSFVFDGRLDREICRLLLQPSSDWDYAETYEKNLTKDKELKYRLAPSSLGTVLMVTKWAFRQFDQTDQELRSVLRRCKYIELQPKQRVFRQGDESDAFYIVLSGSLRETATDACRCAPRDSDILTHFSITNRSAVSYPARPPARILLWRELCIWNSSQNDCECS